MIEKYKNVGAIAKKTYRKDIFENGTSEELRAFIVGEIRGSDSDELWRAKASLMISAVLNALTELRDNYGLVLDAFKIHDQMSLSGIVGFSFIRYSEKEYELSERTLIQVNKYLDSLPGFTEEDAIMDNIHHKSYESHSYLTMQLSQPLLDIAKIYGHVLSPESESSNCKKIHFE